ncbi:MAG TPA: hypothetical protein VKB46_11230 [Pyrinomonadaceae bacterium]|nr:hypothetical protein [Pyrinomonadaceae bacterium]
MKFENFSKKILGAVFTFAIVLGIGLAANVTANAQYPQYPNQYPNDPYRRDRDYRNQRRRDDDDWRNRRNRQNDGYGNYGGSFQLRQTALNAGFNEGTKAGRDDRRHNRRYDFRDESLYQKGTKDYSSRLGDRGTYQAYFREAFEHGYADGYQGY